jgi:hypothetical protein
MRSQIRTARTTGLFYLGLALAGLFGFLLIRPQLYVDGDAGETLARLVEHESLARLGIALEMLIVLTMALAALWFYRLFRTTDQFAAGCIAAFGLVNAGAVLGSAALSATALEVALTPDSDAADTYNLYATGENLWGVGGMFFGLWLIPMGWCALRSRWMPRTLGWLLIGGGVGYVVSAFVPYLAPDAQTVADVLVVPATAGELWMIGYLLIRGIGTHARNEDPRDTAAPPLASASGA